MGFDFLTNVQTEQLLLSVYFQFFFPLQFQVNTHLRKEEGKKNSLKLRSPGNFARAIA